MINKFSDVTIDSSTESSLNIPKNTILDAKTVDTVLSITFGIMASVAFLIIVLSGLRLVLGQGSPDSLTKTKNTIIYACVGLVVAVLAFSIVKFVVRSL